MSKASDTFAQSIRDAENLLKHFNTLNAKPPPLDIEVIKRAGLVMAMTAWETYVEDRLLEACTQRLDGVADASLVAFIESKLADEIKRLHNPASQKTIELFRDYAGVDLSDSWHWNNHDGETVRKNLDEYIKLRGDVVHRSRTPVSGTPSKHAVTKAGLQKAINFLKNLVDATERASAPTDGH